ncbi:hypothetical protein FD755_022527 [Muntiacus reevesi]|uniref:Ras-related GTP-binding protein n=1 Tax=Muntiacus reevesi TaxID=9886 RepID=A0A5N3W0H7_MUNRE|nr:hypothetical protein FD755_022527 [Muntiacus reevesi]
MNLPTGCGGLERQRSGLACQGTVLSLQYWAEETPLPGKYRTQEEGEAAGGRVRMGASGGCGPSRVLTAPSQGFCSWASGATGKSCIQKTLFLEKTKKTYKDDISNSSFVNFQIWGFSGQMDFLDPTFGLRRSSGGQEANDDLADAGLEKLHLSFYFTSIYDGSIFAAFSKVLPKLIPQLPILENLLNIIISNSGIEKELCCDMIDVVIYVSLLTTKESMAIIKLNNTTVLYLKEVTKFLALVCIHREETVHEVSEVGVASHRRCNHQTSAPSLKALTHNCTP